MPPPPAVSPPTGLLPASQEEPGSGFSSPLDTNLIQHILASDSIAPTDQVYGLLEVFTHDAISSAIESSLIGIDISFINRDCDAPISAVAAMNGSWEAEEAPVPCTMDSWLRSVMPETHQQAKPSYAMSQFLQQGGQSLKRASSRSSYSSSISRGASMAGSPEQEPDSKTTPAKNEKVKATPLATDTERSVITASPDIKRQEDRLREELAVRRAQAQSAAQQEADDAAEKTRVAQLAKDFRGKEYSYDHKGKVIVLESQASGYGSKDQESGPAYKVSLPQPPSDGDQTGRGSPNRLRKNNPAPTSSKGGTKASKAAEKERKLAADYKEAKSTSQPSALETLRPNAGVTLRQGGQSKAGPVSARPVGEGVSKDELTRMKSRQQAGHSGQGSAGSEPSPPPTFGATSAPQKSLPEKNPTQFLTDSSEQGFIASLPDAPSAFSGASASPVKATLNGSNSKSPVNNIDAINSLLLNSPDWGRGGGVSSSATGSPMLKSVKVPPLATLQTRDRLPPVALTSSAKIKH